ncbi:unnamed protein product [Meloidogyne enterolobii]|uniref:Uncharacterized protein n=2 Tax=Meloidogyne enterolobii TaxID=390850 RepID=A0ACB1A2S6_MELEN|nr:unnamed protein product [Meloidogyne enterolobii]
MKVVALISGGKDSCFNMLKCFEEGHQVVCLANLFPPEQEEIDSYMYQSVGSEGIELFAEALGLSLFRRQINGKPKSLENEYVFDSEDEVEDLFQLLDEIKRWDPEIEGVSVGAINSTYQKKRVEDVCQRLELKPLCYLWEEDQLKLLDSMISAGVEAIIIKVAALGLDVEHLGKTIKEMRAHLIKMHSKWGSHICGEGGEFETFVLDCPLFKKRISMGTEPKIVRCSGDQSVAPVAFLRLENLELVEK